MKYHSRIDEKPSVFVRLLRSVHRAPSSGKMENLLSVLLCIRTVHPHIQAPHSWKRVSFQWTSVAEKKIPAVYQQYTHTKSTKTTTEEEEEEERMPVHNALKQPPIMLRTVEKCLWICWWYRCHQFTCSSVYERFVRSVYLSRIASLFNSEHKHSTESAIALNFRNGLFDFIFNFSFPSKQRSDAVFHSVNFCGANKKDAFTNNFFSSFFATVTAKCKKRERGRDIVKKNTANKNKWQSSIETLVVISI